MYVCVCFLRELLVNYRHPDPRRVWKGGSGQHFTTSIRTIRTIRPCVPSECFVYAKRYFCLWQPSLAAWPPPGRPWPPPGDRRSPQMGYPPKGEGGYPQNDEKIKVLRMKFSIVEKLSGLQESIFSPNSILVKKSKTWSVFIFNSRYTAQPPWAACLLICRNSK